MALPVRLALLLGCLLLSACSGPREAAEPEPPPPPQTYALSEFEDFDPSAYRDEPQSRTVDVDHDVPGALMDGKVERANTSRMTDGYRVQVFSTQNKAEADAKVDALIAWWRSRDSAGDLDGVYPGSEDEPPVYLAFRQPYYRVRVGNFATRAEARAFQGYIERSFPGAFVLPDRVVLTR